MDHRGARRDGRKLIVSQVIHQHVYPNGLVLLAEEMRGVESAAFNFRLPAGSIHETEDRAGVAGIVCDMTLRGAGPRDSRALINDLDNLGVDRGESVHDAHTSYGGATLAKNLLPALEIYADIVRRPHLRAEHLEPARLVAQQELQGVEDEPSQKVMLELKRAFFPDPWGRPSIGSRDGVEAVVLDDVLRFHAARYIPNGTVLGVAGRIDFAQVRDAIGRLFGDWEPATDPPVVEGPGPAALSHLAHESNQTHIAIAYPSIPYAHENYFQAWGAISVLSGGMSSRLFSEVREKRGLCYTVYASQHSLRDRGAVLCYAGTSAERAQETLDVVLEELTKLASGIQAVELNRAKARSKSALIMQQESSSARAGSIARDWYYLGRVRTLDEIAALVDGLSAESINAYLAQNPPGDFTVVTLGSKPLEVRRAIS